MRQRSRILLAATLAAGLVVTSGLPASAAYDAAELGCRASITKNGGKLVKTYLKTLTGCHKARAKDGALIGTDCNDLVEADFKLKLPKAEEKFLAGVGGPKSKCLGIDPSDVLFNDCPEPCDDGPMVDFGDVADCMLCLTKANVQAYSIDTAGMPAMSPLTADDASCQNAITGNGAKVVNLILKDVSKCQSTAEKAGTETIDACADSGFPSDAVNDGQLSAQNAIAAGCDAANFGNLDTCGAGQFAVSTCVPVSAQVSGQALITSFLQLGDVVTTTTTTTTTMGGPGSDPQCPNVGELTLYSRDTNTACDEDADCTLPRTCNLTLGICQSQTDLDSGWNGVSHNADINDNIKTRARLLCPGPNSPTGCGECTIEGIDPAPGNCRCANNTRNICDQPFVADADDCGGAVCQCFFGSPFALAAGGTPACILNRFSEDITGTANVDLGAGAITAKLRTQVFLGEDLITPCPTCGGKCSGDPSRPCQTDAHCENTFPDPGVGPCVNTEVAGDGVRDGLCFGGRDPGLDCDASGTSASFPVTVGGGAGGGAYSLDCRPAIGKNVSGTGLRLTLQQTTGSSSIASVVDCGGPYAGTDCACRVCSKDESVPCSSDAECSAQGPDHCSLVPNSNCTVDGDCAALNLGTCTAIMNTRCSIDTTYPCTVDADCNPVNGGTCELSTCSSNGTGIQPQPNECTGGLCSDLGGGEGECTTGPENYSCDGMVKANGIGYVGCDPNAIPSTLDCTSVDPLAGDCTLVERRSCFLDPIVATGTPDPEFPVAGAVFCVPPTSNSGINSAAGLPGPGRAVNQGEAHTFCASDNNVEYQPGADVCP